MAKAKRRSAASYQQQEPQQSFNDRQNVVYLQQTRRPVSLIPKTLKQEEYIEQLLEWNTHIVFSVGPAGSGKTLLAVLAGIKALKGKEISKLIITRPVVGVDEEDIGFLPGGIEEKMMPWMRPIMDVMQEYFPAREITKMLEDGTLEMSPLSLMRGRTFKDAWIVADEMQSSSVNQMKMLTTRLGDGSKMVITGDLEQLDRKFATDNGLLDFLSRLKARKSSMIKFVEFGRCDVQRHAVVREILDLYDLE